MQYIAGIDEAGYGPKLGPLVVTISAVETTDDNDHPKKVISKLFKGLEKNISNNQRLKITDSKKIYHKKRDFYKLESVVFYFLHLLGLKVDSFKHFINHFGFLYKPDDSIPWLKDDFPLPLNKLDNLQIQEDFTIEDNLKLIPPKIIILEPYQFNEELEKYENNKANLLADLILRAIKEVTSNYSRSNHNFKFTIFSDKLGGRKGYSDFIRRYFTNAHIKKCKETATNSRYEIILNTNPKITISFLCKGENKNKLIALSSIFSKYTRELFMHAFNSYWQKYVSVPATSGYHNKNTEDFLQKVEKVRQEKNISLNYLIRKI